MRYLTSIMAVVCIAACSSKQGSGCVTSFELDPRNQRDTVNVRDCHGKQGKWVPNKYSNNLKEITYYRNDTVIQKP